MSPPISVATSEKASVQYEKELFDKPQVPLSVALIQERLVNMTICSDFN